MYEHLNNKKPLKFAEITFNIFKIGSQNLSHAQGGVKSYYKGHGTRFAPPPIVVKGGQSDFRALYLSRDLV